VTKDQAEELLETKKEAIAGEIATIEEELSTVRSTLGDLKAALYSRFGKSINLEE
jgi:chaperonin cofactor prefoldin